MRELLFWLSIFGPLLVGFFVVLLFGMIWR
jgi:hypothetical protein